MGRLLTGPAWMGLTEFVDYVSTCFTIPINVLLLYCIRTKSGKSFGKYKNLMTFFSIQSIFFSIQATLNHMCFHTIGGTFMMFTLTNHFNLPPWGVWINLGICCISVGYVLLILSAQFIYRYFAMNKPEKLIYFSGWRRIFFLLAMILVAVVYGGCGFVGINLTPEKDISIRETMGKAYNVTPEEIHYVAVEYFVRDENDERVLNYLSIGTAIMLNTIFGCMVIVIIYCGWNTYTRTHQCTAQLSNHMKIQHSHTDDSHFHTMHHFLYSPNI
ncbi:hypothetical protein CRE_20127 [Caenorhabditis remanei]|uniref:Uncharacterized protein n=1 Tax=Caenorhabditis remanei TaxID=31234 RepID=E3NQE1_CAERE|nr:hypothetical protein CRE_20127 [Caenorhabditis remanei]